MDDPRFDRLTRAVGALTSRRAALRAAGGSALVALGLADADANKKKKTCKKPKVKCGKKCCAAGLRCVNGRCASPPPPDECDFTKSATLWTLQADCAITRTIDVPNGVVLDGNNNTISVTGPASGYDVAAISAKGGDATVKNLSIVGNGAATCGGPLGVLGIDFRDTAGAIADVSVSDTDCVSAINLFGSGSQKVTLTRVSADVPLGDAIVAFGVQVDIDDSTVTGSLFFLNATGSVTESTVTSVAAGVILAAGCDFLIEGNEIDAGETGVAVLGGSNADVMGNTIVGPGPDASAPNLRFAGVQYEGSGTSGAVSGNTISNFFDADAGAVGCGIFVEDGSDAVIGANTFPTPPGNEQDVCDNRD